MEANISFSLKKEVMYATFKSTNETKLLLSLYLLQNKTDEGAILFQFYK